MVCQRRQCWCVTARQRVRDQKQSSDCGTYTSNCDCWSYASTPNDCVGEEVGGGGKKKGQACTPGPRGVEGSQRPRLPLFFFFVVFGFKLNTKLYLRHFPVDAQKARK